MAMLGEVVVHGIDIREPLGIDDDISIDAKLACLDMFKRSNFPVPAKRMIAGLRLRATDAEWTSGSGPRSSDDECVAHGDDRARPAGVSERRGRCGASPATNVVTRADQALRKETK